MKMKTCKNCNNCKQIYRKYFYRFWKEHSYFCCINSKIVKEQIPCVYWEKKLKEFDLSSQRFDLIKNDLEKISDYVKKMDS